MTPTLVLSIRRQRPSRLSWCTWSLHNSGPTFNFASHQNSSTQFHHLQHLSFDFLYTTSPPNPQTVILHSVLNHWRHKLIVTQPNYSYPLTYPNIFFQVSPLGLNVYGINWKQKLINPHPLKYHHWGWMFTEKSKTYFFSYEVIRFWNNYISALVF